MVVKNIGSIQCLRLKYVVNFQIVEGKKKPQTNQPECMKSAEVVQM